MNFVGIGKQNESIGLFQCLQEGFRKQRLWQEHASPKLLELFQGGTQLQRFRNESIEVGRGDLSRFVVEDQGIIG